MRTAKLFEIQINNSRFTLYLYLRAWLVQYNSAEHTQDVDTLKISTVV